MHPKVTATLGRQAFTLGQGITLSDDGIGFAGARLEMERMMRNIKGEFFFFRPYETAGFVKITGGGLYYPSSEGLWHLYHFWEHADQEPGADPTPEVGYTSMSRVKKLTGLRYFIAHNQLNFDGEVLIQRGYARQPENRGQVKYRGYAFIMKGSWNQNITYFGQSKMRMAFGKSSGNSGPVSNLDKAFQPSFGHRFKGIERDGFGEVAGASLYDMIQTSGTRNGLPNGISGLNILNVGLDMPLRKMTLSVDLFKFRAAQNAREGGPTQLGSEWDIKLIYPMGDSLRMKAVYAFFKPLSVYEENSAIKLVSLALTAKF
jgi:hypothetical protein